MAQHSEIRDGMRIEWDVPIRAGDDLILRADIFRPPGDDPVPVILSYGPYAKGLAFQDGYAGQWEIMIREHPDVAAGSSNKYQSWEVADPEKWVPHGYACVRVDSRGAGRSPGVIDPFSPRETRDLYESIEWAGVQPWCNGNVGLAGISYYAINQWQVASLQPPHLTAICPWEGAADWYRDMQYHGGIRCTFQDHWFEKQVVIVQHGLGDRGDTSRITGELVAGPETLSASELESCRVDLAGQINDNPLDGEYHRAHSADWSKVTVPLLSAGNWGGQGLHLRGNVTAFEEAASGQKWLEIHGREHWTEFYTHYGIAIQRRFFDHFLKGEDNGWQDQPALQLQIRTVDGFVQRFEDEWPLARTQWTRTYLHAAGSAIADTVPGAAASITYEAGDTGVTFLAPALEHETELTGPISARIFISSATSDADIFLILHLFDPDGNEISFQGALDPHAPIGQGWLRASHRALDPQRSRPERPYHPHVSTEPLTPGQVYQLDIEIWPTCIVAPAGYRFGLSVQGSDYERDDVGASLDTFVNVMRGSGPFLHDDPANRPAEIYAGEVTIHTGPDYPSSLLLPVIPPKP